MSFNPDHQQDGWGAPQDAPTDKPKQLAIAYREIQFHHWAKIIAVGLSELAVALMLAASFQAINPVAMDVYLVDFLPLPDAMANITMNAVINFGLGVSTVLLPNTIWGYVLDAEFSNDAFGYFRGKPICIGVAAILCLTYSTLILLEIFALKARIDSSLDTGPIATIGEQADILPMAIASFALILGTCLLGLASASLTQSITRHYGTYR